jgi:prevent-host-death family protein
MRRSKSRTGKKPQPPRKTRLSGIRVATMTEFRRRNGKLLDELDRIRVIPITRHGKPLMVMIQIEEYEQLLADNLSPSSLARMEKVWRFMNDYGAAQPLY